MSLNNNYENEINVCYNCNVCEKNFESNSNFMKHTCQNVEKKLPQCARCDKIFLRKEALTNHMKICYLKQHTYCQKCDKKFETPASYNNHLHSHREIIYQSDVCEKVFNHFDVTVYRRHSETHNNDRSNVCSICNKKFKDQSSLKTHIKIHSDEKPFRCKICSVSFRNKRCFNRHMDKHTKAISYQCQYCDKLSYSASTHYNHMRNHHRDKLYFCHVCNEKFEDSSKFVAHQKTHTIDELHTQKICSESASSSQLPKKMHKTCTASDNKPYKCDKCSFSCSSSRALNQHKSRTHNNLPKPSHDVVLRRLRFVRLLKHSKSFKKCSKYECGLCKKTFPSLTDHNQHLPSHKNETLTSCMICKASYSFTTELIEHCLEYSSNEHHFCKTCREKFETSDEYTKHKQTRHVHPCDKCKRSFFTSRSLREHSCPYKTSLFCEFCSKDYTSLNSLRSHFRNHHSQQKVTQITSVVKQQQFHCEKCTKSFMSRNKLVRHKSCRCDFCDELFNCESELLQHRVLHNKPRPDISLDVKSTKCIACHETFIDNDKYHLHSCIGRYKSKNNFNSENIVQTDSNKKDSSFNSLDLDDSVNLINISNNHEELVFCMDSITIESNVDNDVSSNEILPVPNLTNNTKELIGTNALKLHFRKYPYQKVTKTTPAVEQQFYCEKCSKSFMLEDEFVKHKSFRCIFCGEPFDCEIAFLQHSVLHNKEPDIFLNEKSIKCDVCYETVADKNKFHLHLCSGRSLFSKSKNNFNSENIIQTDSYKKDSSFKNLHLDDSVNLKNSIYNTTYKELAVPFIESNTKESNIDNDCEIVFESKLKLIDRDCSGKEKIFKQSMMIDNNFGINTNLEKSVFENLVGSIKLSEEILPVPTLYSNTKQLSLSNHCDVSNESVTSEPRLIEDECSRSKKNLQCYSFDKSLSIACLSSLASSNEINKLLCDFCDKKYCNKWSLKQHLFTEHVDKQSYICKYCEKKFPYISAYKNHLASHNLD